MKFRSVKAHGKVIQFHQSLEDLFRNCDWSDRGVSINGSKLSNLRFADDVTIIAQDLGNWKLVLMSSQ